MESCDSGKGYRGSGDKDNSCTFREGSSEFRRSEGLRCTNTPSTMHRIGRCLHRPHKWKAVWRLKIK